MGTPIAPSISLDLIKIDLKRHGYYLIARRKKHREEPLDPVISATQREWTTTYEVYLRTTRKYVVKFSSKGELRAWIDGGCSMLADLTDLC